MNAIWARNFLLNFSNCRHSQVQSLRKERLLFIDPVLLQTIDLEALMPMDIEDEAIFEDRIISEPSPQPNLTTGFNITSLVFLAAIQARRPCSAADTICATCMCRCAQHNNRYRQIAHLQGRLQELKYTLDAIPPELRQWAVQPILPTMDISPESAQILNSQFGAVRANLHVTHLWLRSILLDQLENLISEPPSPSIDAPSYLATVEGRWSERENLSSQLIHVLHAIPPQDLEPNGLHLAYKVRDVAVGLLSCPFEPHEPASLRAAEFVREFTQILSRLDASESVATTNLQTWVDTDRERGRRGRHDLTGCDNTFAWK